MTPEKQNKTKQDRIQSPVGERWGFSGPDYLAPRRDQERLQSSCASGTCWDTEAYVSLQHFQLLVPSEKKNDEVWQNINRRKQRSSGCQVCQDKAVNGPGTMKKTQLFG